MSNANAKAVAPSNEELMQLILSLKAENETLKAARTGGVSVTDKGQIAVTFPSGNGSITARYYSWQWEAILKCEKEIRAAFKDRKAMTEKQFRASKSK
jgi:hypothetical protein